MSDERITCFKVQPEGYNFCVVKGLEDLIDDLRDHFHPVNTYEGHKVTIETLEMTEDEFDKLPEFEGY